MKVFWNASWALILFLFSISSAATAAVKMGYSEGYSSTLRVHYGVFNSDTKPSVGDVLYFHGYGDTFENHLQLFKELNDNGLRVIAFDLPSHGRTSGAAWDDLDWYSFHDLADIAASIERETQEDASRPLILAGWSTGGLLAVRITQMGPQSPLSRSPKGLLLYAPAVSVPICVGEGICQITNETLTHDRLRYQRPISPSSPLFRVNFAANLLYEASESWSKLPSNIPVLTWVAGDSEDRYVNSMQIKSWITKQRSQRKGQTIASQCVGARHELDNETNEFGGDYVRRISAAFARKISIRESFRLDVSNSRNCRSI